MTILVRLRSFFRAIFRRPKIERELNQELLNFLELSATEKVRHGIEPSEARRLARLELGGVEQTKEQVRSTLPAAMFDSLRQDTRYAVRSLRRSPTFTAVALLSLALGIGVATATFSVLDAILLRPIPYDDPDRVVNVWASFPEWRNESGLSEMADEMTVFYPDYLDWSRRQSVFEDTAIVEYSEADWLESGFAAVGPRRSYHPRVVCAIGCRRKPRTTLRSRRRGHEFRSPELPCVATGVRWGRRCHW